MSEIYRPQRGDRVRVVIEGESSDVGEFGQFCIGNRHVNIINPEGEHVVSVEKIEPPVEQFGPGDVVRSKAFGTVRVLGEKGYVIIASKGQGSPRVGTQYHFGDGIAIPLRKFTSEDYEKVDLSSVL